MIAFKPIAKHTHAAAGCFIAAMVTAGVLVSSIFTGTALAAEASDLTFKEQLLKVPASSEKGFGVSPAALTDQDGANSSSEKNGSSAMVFYTPVENPIISMKYETMPGHNGVDFVVKAGTPVIAAADGVVIASKYNGAYGYTVCIDHGNGIETLYAHNSKLLAGAGDKVTQGQEIALAGQSGNATGPLCHFEIKINGEYVDPETIMQEVPAPPGQSK